MSKSSSLDDDDLASPEYLYTVLNLPTTASGEEIRDRYRHLSLVFHPDKQRDENLRETAMKRFLEVQKAYEVLSDPITRQAYDLYGLRGLSLVPGLRVNSDVHEEIALELARKKAEQDFLLNLQVLDNTTRTLVGVDARSLFNERDDDSALPQRIVNRLSDVRAVNLSVRNKIEKAVGPRTRFLCTCETAANIVDPRVGGIGNSFIGTISHQMSSRWALTASSSLLRQRDLRIGSVFAQGDYQLNADVHFSPLALSSIANLGIWRSRPASLAPSLRLSLARRLFPRSQTWGQIDVSTNHLLGVQEIQFVIANRQVEQDGEQAQRQHYSPSLTGLSAYQMNWTVGLKLVTVLPVLFANYGVNFRELGLGLMTGLELGASTSAVLGATWTSEEQKVPTGLRSIGAKIAIGLREISLEVKAVWLNQTLRIPVVFSQGFNSEAALWTTVLPSTVVALAYCFILRPRQRQRRLEFYRQARRDLREAKADKIRPAEETVSLLRDTAKRQMRAEASVDGLIIVDARYGPAEQDEYTRGLDIDVTIPLQVLVHNSQLFIPGQRSKAGLHGFYDPAPPVAKRLRVHYTFRGRPHYAEVEDKMPLVLPLSAHQV